MYEYNPYDECDECGESDITVQTSLDPFVADVNNEEWYRDLCDPCYERLCDEV